MPENKNRLKILSILLLVVTIAGYGSSFFFLFDLMSHLRFQYLIFGTILLIPLILIKKPKWTIVIVAISLIINAIELFPWLYLVHKSDFKDKNGVKIFLSNVYTSNQNYQALIKLINKSNPGIVVLQEVNHQWLDAIKVIETTYPYKIKVTRSDNFGMAVFSKTPMDNARIEHWGELQCPVILFETNINSTKINIASVHTTPPINQTYFNNRNKQLSLASKWVKLNNSSSIVLGDLNTTPFSASYKALVGDSGLINGAKKFGWNPTWPTKLPQPLRIPIDTVLHTNELQVLELKTGNQIGSDHLPVIVEIGLSS